MNVLLKFITNPHNDFVGHTFIFIKICFIAIIPATLLGISLGIVISRSAVLSFLIVNLSGLMRAIPIIAFLIIVIPYLGIGVRPTVVALIILGIPPVLLNTYTGIRGIDPAILDVAKGIGMTNWQIITRIQTPLVLPLVAAGIRTSAVQIVATAPIAAIIGAGGYGSYIIDGLYRLNNIEVLAGAIPVAMVALVLEMILSWFEHLLTPAGFRISDQTGSF